MCIVEKLRRKLKELNAELDDLYTMSEQAACECYEVDTKEEAISILIDEIQSTSKDLEHTEEEAKPIGWGGIDPAFVSLADYYQMRL